MDWTALSKILCQKLDKPIHIINAIELAGGDIHQAYRLHTSDGDYFLKLNQIQYAPLLKTEANSLKKLAETGSMTLPSVIAQGVLPSTSSNTKSNKNDQAWLLLSYIDLSHQGDDYQRGQDLAMLHHQINPTKQFGWFENNYIGHTLQSNAWQDNWVAFYGQQRLLPQLQLAAKNQAPKALIADGNQLIKQLPQFFENYQPEASLLHGDLWAGNSGFDPVGNPVFFDPASYYGDRETDLAMTELFGGYGTDFYQGYQQVFPLDAGYEQRKSLYQLYHLLNHFNLFGKSYLSQVERLVQRLLNA